MTSLTLSVKTSVSASCPMLPNEYIVNEAGRKRNKQIYQSTLAVNMTQCRLFDDNRVIEVGLCIDQTAANVATLLLHDAGSSGVGSERAVGQLSPYKNYGAVPPHRLLSSNF